MASPPYAFLPPLHSLPPPSPHLLSLIPSPRPSDLSRTLTHHIQSLSYYDAGPYAFKVLLADLGVTRVQLRAKLNNAVAELTKVELRLVCQGMWRLPRELRDEVYGELLQGLSMNVLLPLERGSGTAKADLVWRVDESEYLFDERFVGEAMRCEIVEAWYRTRRFLVEGEWEKTLQGLERGVGGDVFGFGIAGFVAGE